VDISGRFRAQLEPDGSAKQAEPELKKDGNEKQHNIELF
jgi:hypothetical protein